MLKDSEEPDLKAVKEGVQKKQAPATPDKQTAET
jgi:hypothetical protein